MAQSIRETIQDGRRRVIVEAVTPQINAGRFPVKRVAGESLQVEADILADGHDVLAAVLKFRQRDQSQWSERPMTPLGNDRWRGTFTVTTVGLHFYTIEAWIDRFQSWRRELEKKVRAGLDVQIELMAGAELLDLAVKRCAGGDAEELQSAANILTNSALPVESRVGIALSARIAELMASHSERRHATVYEQELPLAVDRGLARCGAWYEMFPRSTAREPGRHGTFKDCEALLPLVAQMGFDVLYLPPIHPIGQSFRKGKNNHPTAGPGEPGSPWAIGAAEGGHKAILPALGTLEDFQHLVRRAQELDLELALDVAFQCSPDHPYVREHPEWFRRRPDGSIQYAENPPKKYQDIYPIDFESDDWEALWTELKSVFEFWIGHGIRIFRVDNPHTKSFRFWEWCLGELKNAHPDLIFLSEAFTRPKLMYYLAKLGFTQSYNYFPWRNTKAELTEYFTELNETEVHEFFRPALWPNTPDILTQYLQYGGRPAFMARLILAATLGATYGIYGPAFELCEHQPRELGSEEYLDSEKYEIRHWDRSAPGNLKDLIRRVNQVRRENPALQTNATLQFHFTDNEQIIAYSKHSPDLDNIVICIVNLDPHHTQRGWVELAVDKLGLSPQANYQCHDLLTESRFLWSGRRNYVELNPQFLPAHLFRLRRYVRTEHDFDYFL